MENEAMNLEVQEEVYNIPPKDEEPVLTEETVSETETQAEQPVSEKFQDLKSRCLSSYQRIAYDLKETNFNPYIRRTRTCKVEIFHNKEEETPIDVFETEDVKGYTAKSLAIASLATVALVSAGDRIFRTLIKK